MPTCRSCLNSASRRRNGFDPIALQSSAKSNTIAVMKLALAVLVYLLMGLVLAAGVLLLLSGKPWLLLIGLVAFVVAFGKIGCMSH
jgi:hypothetical protein